MMKIERVTFIWTFTFTMNFELPEMSKKWSYGFFRPNLPQLWLFHQYFVCKSSFRVISMIKMVIFGSKYANLVIFENKKFKNSKFVNCMFIIHKNGNNTSIQHILKSNSTSFMFNDIFCEMKGKKVIHCWWNGGPVLISSWRCNFSIYLDIQAITTLYAFYWLFMC